MTKQMIDMMNKVNEIHTSVAVIQSDVVAIKEQTTKTNGRVTKLEVARGFTKGAMWVISAILVTALVLFFVKYDTITKLEQVHKTELSK